MLFNLNKQLRPSERLGFCCFCIYESKVEDHDYTGNLFHTPFNGNVDIIATELKGLSYEP